MSKYLPLNLFIRQALLYPLTAPFLPSVGDVKKDVEYAAGKLIGTLESAPAQGVAFTGQVTQYRAGDDGDYQKGYTLTRPIVKGLFGNTRFDIHGDNTVTDLATGLMWVRDFVALGAPFNAGANWNDAVDNCEALDYAGHQDWRLPNIKELFSLIDVSIADPTIDVGVFPNMPSASFRLHWTSSGKDIANKFYLRFDSGTAGPTANLSNAWWVRPVRLGEP